MVHLSSHEPFTGSVAPCSSMGCGVPVSTSYDDDEDNYSPLIECQKVRCLRAIPPSTLKKLLLHQRLFATFGTIDCEVKV